MNKKSQGSSIFQALPKIVFALICGLSNFAFALVITSSPAPTTLSLSLSKPTASLGENVTLTAKVTGGYIPSGLVTFSSGAGALGTASVAGGAATFSINNLGVGSHTLSASYAGDTSNQASSSGSVSLM